MKADTSNLIYNGGSYGATKYHCPECDREFFCPFHTHQLTIPYSMGLKVLTIKVEHMGTCVLTHRVHHTVKKKSQTLCRNEHV